MKRPFFLPLLFLIACSTSNQADQTSADSLANTDLVSEKDSSSISNTIDLPEERSYSYFNLTGKAGTGAVDGENIVSMLRKVYIPDILITGEGSSNADVDFTVTAAEPIQGKFANYKGECEKSSLLLTTVMKNGEEEEFHLFVIKRDERKARYGVRIGSFEGAYAQSYATVDISQEYELAKGCAALAVLHSSEGGDINLTREKSIRFYVATNEGFQEALMLELESTEVQDFEATGDETKNSVIETRTFEVTDNINNNLFDIKATYVKKENGAVTEQREELYVYDAEVYVKQIAADQ